MVKTGSVKGGRSTIYRDLKIAQGGGKLKHSNFSTRGKPPLLSNNDIKNISEKSMIIMGERMKVVRLKL